MKQRYPEASAALEKLALERGYVDEVTGCCRIKHQNLAPDDTAVCVCVNCMAMIDEDADNGALEQIYALMDNDPGLRLPSYAGKKMTVQDCGRSYDRRELQEAIRSLLRKMDIEVIEAPDACEKSVYCGASFMHAAPKQDAGFAPRRYVEEASNRGIFIERGDEEVNEALKEHVQALPLLDVVCYCTACDAGLEAGGARPVNMIELVTGEFIERPY